MITLTSIIEDRQTKVMTKYHAFFAFGQSQHEEKRERQFKYISLGMGLIVPEIFANSLIDRMGQIHATAIKWHEAIETKKDIIWYELSNHECQIVMSPDDAITALQDYPSISEQDIRDEYSDYFQHCIDNDYF